MSGIADTLARLSRNGGAAFGNLGQSGQSALSPFSEFGSNPGQLVAKSFVPGTLAPGAALVVVLHGCTQTADAYDRGAGWSQLAAEAGIALLYPEQHRANNANLCFNWFERDDVTRGRGEVASIRQMIAAMLSRHDLDPARVFVTGLSAGRAMTSALLAAYPDVFAGGAIIAGLPFGSADGVTQALQRMRSAGPVRCATVRDEIMAATGHAGPWPSVSVWHGAADHTVHVSNARAIVEQWRAIHGADPAPTSEARIDGQTRRIWRDPAGREVIESWTIAGMGHGTPLITTGSDACGRAGPHMLEAGISSTRHIARFWGLVPAAGVDRRFAVEAVPAALSSTPIQVAAVSPVGKVGPESGVGAAVDYGPGAVIERALRAAGLMK